MAKIETGRYSDTLRRFLGMKGTSDVATELAPEISGVFVLENDRPDWHFLKGDRLAGVGVEKAAGGATLGPTIRLRNPLTSGVMAIFTKVQVYCNLNVRMETRLTISNNDLGGGAVALFVRDTRLLQTLGINKSALVGSFNTTIGPVGDMIVIETVPGDATGLSVLKSTDPIVLTPGRALDVGANAAAAKVIQITFAWIERPLPNVEAQ